MRRKVVPQGSPRRDDSIDSRRLGFSLLGETDHGPTVVDDGLKTAGSKPQTSLPIEDLSGEKVATIGSTTGHR